MRNGTGSRGKWPRILVVALLGALLAGAPAVGARAAFPGENGKILFVRLGPPRLLTIRPDGGGLSRISTGGRRFLPDWSADGKRIAFNSGNIYRCHDIYVMSARGKDVRRLTDNQHCDLAPSWSPNGQRIVFQSDRPTPASARVLKKRDRPSELYVMRSDGKQVTRLTRARRDAICPAWSPDGAHIAFTMGLGHAADVYVIDRDGGDRRRLTRAPGADMCPDWSPDGKRLVFSTARDDAGSRPPNFEIYVMKADGSLERRVTRDPAPDHDPAWSPDGSLIVFQRFTPAPSDRDLYLIRPDGSDETVLTHNDALDDQPVWRPVD
jgi:Tol biopolymer transport system component